MAGRRFIAQRMSEVHASGIRRVFDLAATLKDPIDFSIGQPDFPVPPPVMKAMISAIESNHNGYTVTRGIPQLRERIASSLKQEFGTAPEVMATSGVSGGLTAALMATLDPGDEVLFADPSFVSYRHLIRLAGGVPVPVNLYDDFQLHPERFARAGTSRTKIVILASPGNPTGVVFAESDVRAMAQLAQERDWLIVSDEIYGALAYDGPVASAYRMAPERTLLLRGFGKSHALTGLRIGFAAGPPDLIAEMTKVQQYTFVCAPQPAQYAALAALDTDIFHHVAAYRTKRDLVCAELKDSFQFAHPTGGFYVFPQVPPGYASASAFAAEAVKRNVLVIPGSVFSDADTHFRISYAVPDERIRRGCSVLREMVRP